MQGILTSLSFRPRCMAALLLPEFPLLDLGTFESKNKANYLHKTPKLT